MRCSTLTDTFFSLITLVEFRETRLKKLTTGSEGGGKQLTRSNFSNVLVEVLSS